MTAQADGVQRQGESEEILRAVIAQAVIGLAISEPTGRLLQANPAFLKLVGLAEDDMRRGDLFAMVHRDDRPRLVERTRELLDGKSSLLVTEVRFPRDEGISWLKLTVTPLGAPAARAHRLLIQAEDLTGRKHDEATIAQQVRLAEYGRDIGRALTSGSSLSESLAECARATVAHLDAAFARIWIADETRTELVLKASAGLYTHIDGPHSRIPVGQFKIGRIAEQRRPHLTNEVASDPQISSQDWAQSERMVAFAGYPLVVRDRLVGVMALFARHELSDATLQAMASVADEIALGVERQLAEERLHRHEEWLQVTLASIGDAIIATDVQGRITFLNGVAVSLTGWPQHEAQGQPLERVFRIVGEDGHEHVDSPVERALREGAIVGLTNHTILIARDGTEYPIDDSAAPIRDETGSVIGAVLIFRDITERRLTERNLEISESRKSSILETALDAIVMIDDQGRVIEWNPSAERIFGYSRDHAAGREMCELIIPPSLRELHRKGLQHFLDTGEGSVIGRRFETTAIRAEGEEFPIELAIASISGGGLPLFTAHLRDITERKDAEQALRESEERFRHLADALPQVVWESEPDGTLAYFNQRWYDYTGQTPQEALAPDGWRSVVHPDDLCVLDALTAKLAPTDVFEAEYRLRDRHGTYRWHLGRAVPAVAENDQRVLRRYGTATDIDDRKRAEQTAQFLADTSAVLSELVDFEDTLQRIASMAVPAFADWCAVDFVDESGKATRLAVTHPDAGRLRLAHELFEKFPPTLDDPQGIGMVLRTGGSEIVEELRDEDLVASIQDPYHLEMIRTLALRSYICVPLRPRGGRPGALTFVTSESGRHYSPGDLRVAEDLARRATVAIENAELYRALQAANRNKDELLASLRDSEERFRTMAESIPQLAWIARPDGHIFWYNRRWYDYTGVPPEELQGWAWQSIHDPEYLPRVLERWKASIASGDPFDMVFPLRGADGQFRSFLTRVMPLRDNQGRVAQWFGTNTDISDQLRVEDELRAAKEEAEAANQAKTQFLAVLSHELRTPLNPILLAASSMLEQPGDPADLRPTLEMIRQNVLLQARLIDDLLDVMRIVRGKMPLHWEVADCHKLIHQAVQVCRSEVLGHELKLSIQPGATHHHVNADPARLQQVFWNLIKNSVKFTPEGGLVTVRTFNQDAPGRPDGLIVIEVTDNGIGIDAEVLPRIFDPFQQGETTITRRYGGLGLGLAICKGVIEAHGGTITANSAGRGRGTTFRMTLNTLPISVAEASERDNPASPGTSGNRLAPLVILAVEDEPTTLRLMARLLKGLGHEVTTAGSVNEAIRLYEEGHFDLVISDIGLPDGTGLDLMKRAVALKGPIPSIALTGYGMEEDIRRSREAGFTAHLTKPIDFTKLEAMIRQVTP